MTATKEPKNLQALLDLHDTYKGERCFIVGTGPSLNSIPEAWGNRLRGEFTIGVNLIAQTSVPFLDTLDALVVGEWWWVREHGVEWMIDRMGQDFKRPPNLFYCHERPLDGMSDDSWQYVFCTQGKRVVNSFFQGLGIHFDQVGFGGSIVIPAIQISCWMGFDPIYLLGCDGTRSGHAYSKDLEAGDKSLSNVLEFHRASLEACIIMKGEERQLIDLTEGGILPVIKGSLEEVLNAR